MAVKLRLMRMGKKKQPTYRLVAADSRSPRDGRFIEAVGVYAPRGRSSADRDAVVQIDETKVIRWLSQGAKPTDRVERILQKVGTLDRFRSGEPARTEAVTAGGPVPGAGSKAGGSVADAGVAGAGTPTSAAPAAPSVGSAEPARSEPAAGASEQQDSSAVTAEAAASTEAAAGPEAAASTEAAAGPEAAASTEAAAGPDSGSAS